MDGLGTHLDLLDVAVDIVVVLDGAGHFQYANAAVERILGYDPDALVDENAFDYIHPDDCDAVVERFASLTTATEQTVGGSEFRFRDASGSWVWLHARMTGQETSLGGYVVSCRDITERRRAEAETRRSREQLANFATHTTEVLWMFSADWEELLFINDAYETVWGRSVEALETDPADFLRGVHPADRPAVMAAMEQLSGGESVDLEYRVDDSTGYGTWVWVQGRPIVEDGAVTRVIGFARDVTDRKERERQLLVMDRLLRHNLRNDMNVILGHAEQAGEESAAVAADVEKIVDTGERLLRTVDKERDIVALLTSDSEPVELDFVPTVSDVCARVRTEYPVATIETTLPETAPVTAVRKLSLAVFELLTNAIRHATAAEPTVTVTLAVEADRVVLEVADEAPPIPIQEIRLLRGERDIRSVHHGSGLGLWLVYWAVDRSGGTLDFERGTDGGNTVTISLDSAG